MTPCHLVDLVDVILACEDANSKLVIIADVDVEDRVRKFGTDSEAEVWS